MLFTTAKLPPSPKPHNTAFTVNLRRDYNAFSIGIQYNGSLEEDLKFMVSSSNHPQLSSLVDLIVELRSHFPEAKILTTSEIDGKTIRPSDAMNQLRLQLSDLP